MLFSPPLLNELIGAEPTSEELEMRYNELATSHWPLMRAAAVGMVARFHGGQPEVLNRCALWAECSKGTEALLDLALSRVPGLCDLSDRLMNGEGGRADLLSELVLRRDILESAEWVVERVTSNQALIEALRDLDVEPSHDNFQWTGGGQLYDGKLPGKVTWTIQEAQMADPDCWWGRFLDAMSEIMEGQNWFLYSSRRHRQQD